jgi:hypothetical protein
LSEKKDSSDAAFLTIRQSLLSDFSSYLSPPPCQVKEHKPDNPLVVPSSNKPQVTSSDTSDISPTIPAITLNRIAARWQKKIKQRCTKQQYIIGVDKEELQQGILDGTIATTVADSGATSGVDHGRSLSSLWLAIQQVIHPTQRQPHPSHRDGQIPV